MAIITGTDGNDRYNDPAYPGNVELKGTNLADQMYGLAGNDELVGFDGDDLLDGGPGADVLWGGYGLDLASYKGSPAAVSVFLTLPGQLQIRRRRRGATSSTKSRARSARPTATSCWGDEQNNVFRGEGGADHLTGLSGNDRLEGGGGNDNLERRRRERRAASAATATTPPTSSTP